MKPDTKFSIIYYPYGAKNVGKVFLASEHGITQARRLAVRYIRELLKNGRVAILKEENVIHNPYRKKRKFRKKEVIAA